jgi:hypothetical protein
MNNKCTVLPHEWYNLSPLGLLVVPEWYHLVLWLVPSCTMKDTMLIPEWYYLAFWFMRSYFLNDTILCPEWLPPDLSRSFNDTITILPRLPSWMIPHCTLNDTILPCERYYIRLSLTLSCILNDFLHLECWHIDDTILSLVQTCHVVCFAQFLYVLLFEQICEVFVR